MLFKKLIFLNLIGVILTIPTVYSHGGSHHNDNSKKIKALIKKPSEMKELKYKEINQLYLTNVKSILKKSCFNCHSNSVTYPWYYKIPGVKQFIDNDIKEAKEHLNFTNDFPFKGHETPFNDLKAIKEEISSNKMPPKPYQIFHSSEAITKKEQVIIFKWIDYSMNLLK